MTTEPAHARTAPVRAYDALVLESITEAPDTKTLVLDLGPRADYRAGQYVSIHPKQFIGLRSFVSYLEHAKKRREPPRAYSMCSAPQEKYVAITIKEEVYDASQMEFPPLLSGYLVHQVRAGDRMETTGFAGAYVLPEDVETRADHILHLVAGSGSVPNFSMVKDSLQRHAGLRHTFLYSNKTWQDVIFRDALAEISASHPDRLRVIHSLTRETGATPADQDVRRGRISAELLESVLTAEPNSMIFSCGPAITVWERRACAARGTTPTPRFLESMLSLLDTLKVPKERVKIEAYG
jgi:3-ketosteroid 9alpha-monooxygenase subunit B